MTPVLLKPLTVPSTGRGVQGGVEDVASLVAHRKHFFCNVVLGTLQVLLGHFVDGVLHGLPVSDAGVLVEAAGDDACQVARGGRPPLFEQ